jgi:hypothetical protein
MDARGASNKGKEVSKLAALSWVPAASCKK